MALEQPIRTEAALPSRIQLTRRSSCAASNSCLNVASLASCVGCEAGFFDTALHAPSQRLLRKGLYATVGWTHMICYVRQFPKGAHCGYNLTRVPRRFEKEGSWQPY